MKRKSPIKKNPEKIRAWLNKPRKKIRPRSIRRAKEESRYSGKCKEFKRRNPRCWIFPALPTSDVHHIDGREGPLLLDENNWMAISRLAHDFIGLYPQWARNHGFLSGPFREIAPDRCPPYPYANAPTLAEIKERLSRVEND